MIGLKKRREIFILSPLRYYLFIFVSSDLANTDEEREYTRKAHVHLPGVQNHGEKRHPIDHRPFDQLRNRHMAADGSRSGALDTSRHGHDLPIVRLNRSSYKDLIVYFIACRLCNLLVHDIRR